MASYSVYSSGRPDGRASKETHHRTKSAAIKEYFKRYNRGDHYILMQGKSGEVLRQYTAKVVSPAKSNPRRRKRTKANPRKRTTQDVWVIQGRYGQGWEDVNQETTWKDARRSVKEYRENEPQYSHRVILRKEKIAAASNPKRLVPAKIIVSGGKARVFVSAAAMRKMNPAGPTWDVLYTDNGVTRIYTSTRLTYKQAQADAREAKKRGYKRVRIIKLSTDYPTRQK